MKKVIIASVLSCMFAGSAMASAVPQGQDEGFTINPMIGVANNKAFGNQVALGLEAGYNNFLFGYTINGDKEKNSFHQQDFDPVDGQQESHDLSAYSKEKYKAHQMYVGYKFDIGYGKLAIKAGTEASKVKIKNGIRVEEVIQGGTANPMGYDMNVSSKHVFKPMVGVGYHLDNGINFNVHYTFHKGDRDVSGSATAYGPDGSKTVGVKSKTSDKDLSTVMFTVGYRF